MFKMAAAIVTGTGLAGVDIFDDTSAHTGDWWYIHAIEECLFTSVTLSPGTSSGSLAGKTLARGDRFFGPIIGVQLASGTAVCGKAVIRNP